jgi:hypothetical protein
MGQIVTDTFIRANNASLGANWTQDGLGGATIGIASNTATMTGGSNFVIDFYSGAGWTGGNDHYSELLITLIQSGRDTGPMCRVSGSPVSGTGSGYLFVLNDNDAAHSMGDTNWSIALYKVVNNGFTQLGSSVTGVTISAGDIVRLDVQGTTLRGLINGVQKITATDSAISSGKPGFYIGSGTTTTYGNGTTTGFAAGDFAGSVVVPRNNYMAPILTQ